MVMPTNAAGSTSPVPTVRSGFLSRHRARRQPALSPCARASFFAGRGDLFHQARDAGLDAPGWMKLLARAKSHWQWWASFPAWSARRTVRLKWEICWSLDRLQGMPCAEAITTACSAPSRVRHSSLSHWGRALFRCWLPCNSSKGQEMGSCPAKEGGKMSLCLTGIGKGQ